MEFQDVWKFGATWEPRKVKQQPSLGLEPCKQCADDEGEPTGLVVCRKTYSHQDDTCNVPRTHVSPTGDQSSGTPWAADTKQVVVDCSACNATGKGDEDCDICNGEGYYYCEDEDCDEETHDCEECYEGKQACSECKNFAYFYQDGRPQFPEPGYRFIGLGKIVKHMCGACQGTLESKTAATWEPSKVHLPIQEQVPCLACRDGLMKCSSGTADCASVILFAGGMENKGIPICSTTSSDWKKQVIVDCPDCGGNGQVFDSKNGETESCACSMFAKRVGVGKLIMHPCKNCSGSGFAREAATWEPHKVRMLPQEELKSYEVSNEFRNHRLSDGMQYVFPKGRDMSDFIDAETIPGWLGYVANNEDLNWLGIINHRNRRMYVYADTSLDKTDLDEMFRHSVVFNDYGDKDDVGIYSIHLTRKNRRDSYINHASDKCQCAKGDTSPCSDTAFQEMTNGT